MTTKAKYGQVVDFEQHLTDGRLTEPSDEEHYAWRDMIEQSKSLGRPLTDQEFCSQKAETQISAPLSVRSEKK